MEQIVAAIFSLFTSLADVPAAKGLMSTKDTRLTMETATQHIVAARFAGIMTDIDPDLILAIAYRESRFTPDVIGPPLAGGKHACGVMQHVPITGPCPKRTLIADYLAGARHLAGWIRATHGNIEQALAGYAGGYASIARYNEGGARIRAAVQGSFARARSIKRARELSAQPPTKRTHDVSPS